MFGGTEIKQELAKVRSRTRSGGDIVLSETRRILNEELFREKWILENLREYNDSFAVINEEEVDDSLIFTLSEIKAIAVNYRLKFLDSKQYKAGIPYDAIKEIKRLNSAFHKDLSAFSILAPFDAFTKRSSADETLLFVGTNHDNYYLVQSWGQKLAWWRKLSCWPLRSFETLAASVLLFTLILCLSLPTWAITLDRGAAYWSGYRAGVFFHLLIFNSGFTAFCVVAFAGHFSSNLWNKRNNLG